MDTCNRFQAFQHIIIPIMWPGIITTGLFSFLLAYNDFAVTAMLLSQENQTMVLKITSFQGSTQQEGILMSAVAAVVSTTGPHFCCNVLPESVCHGPYCRCSKGLICCSDCCKIHGINQPPFY